MQWIEAEGERLAGSGWCSGQLRWWIVMREKRYCSTPGTTIEVTDQALASSTEKVDDEAASRRVLDCRFWAPKCQWAAGIT